VALFFPSFSKHFFTAKFFHNEIIDETGMYWPVGTEHDGLRRQREGQDDGKEGAADMLPELPSSLLPELPSSSLPELPSGLLPEKRIKSLFFNDIAMEQTPVDSGVCFILKV